MVGVRNLKKNQKKKKLKKGVRYIAQKLKKSMEAVVIEKGLSILRGVSMPAVMIETGYLSNIQESIDLQMPDMRTLLVQKIVSVL